MLGYVRISSGTIFCNSILYDIQYYIQYYTILYYTILYYTILYYTIYNTILYYIQYNTIQYYTDSMRPCPGVTPGRKHTTGQRPARQIEDARYSKLDIACSHCSGSQLYIYIYTYVSISLALSRRISRRRDYTSVDTHLIYLYLYLCQQMSLCACESVLDVCKYVSVSD